MIKVDSLKESSITTKVEPSNNIFKELGNNTYDYKDLLSELIDNSVAQRIQGVQLEINIEILLDDNKAPIEFIIQDTAKGISREDFGICITPAGKLTTGGLNEHGLGMKQAISAIGELNYLASKTSEEQIGTAVKEFAFGEITTFDIENFPLSHGTIISIKKLNKIINTNPSAISNTIIKHLGARYRKYLVEGNKILNLNISLKRYDTKEVLNSWNIEEVKPIYFHPSTRTNSPVIQNYQIEGGTWKAELTFGYAPANKDEYKELQIEPVNRFHPYNVSLSKQGLDILLHKRVILFSQLSEIGIVSSRHNDYNVFRGEINLISGFKTAITKNSIILDHNFQECIQKITNILKGNDIGPNNKVKDYLRLKTFPEELPEKLLRDRLASYLETNPLNKKENVNTEYVIEGIEGYIDILADNEAWELKVQQANALDVYQLFMYMDVGEYEKGFLVAKDFTTGAEIAVKRIKDKHNKIILLTKLEQFPINQQPDENERINYY
ncbi:hypothetical protein KUL156_54020 [Alteromonas sp. KUL156]|nr:hypothetical protein KUL154_10640 [Alteromonas sp. KUL154]GFE02810.1 hypothetical protein KUL156_54020 [Alteromonas sp. KUL156]